jgi:hypothetical protein
MSKKHTEEIIKQQERIISQLHLSIEGYLNDVFDYLVNAGQIRVGRSYWWSYEQIRFKIVYPILTEIINTFTRPNNSLRSIDIERERLADYLDKITHEEDIPSKLLNEMMERYHRIVETNPPPSASDRALLTAPLDEPVQAYVETEIGRRNIPIVEAKITSKSEIAKRNRRHSFPSDSSQPSVIQTKLNVQPHQHELLSNLSIPQDVMLRAIPFEPEQTSDLPPHDRYMSREQIYRTRNQKLPQTANDPYTQPTQIPIRDIVSPQRIADIVYRVQDGDSHQQIFDRFLPLISSDHNNTIRQDVIIGTLDQIINNIHTNATPLQGLGRSKPKSKNNKWISYVKAVQNKYKCTYSQALKLASKTYKK